MVARVIDHPFSAGVIPTPYNPDPALLAIVEIIRNGLIRDQHVRLHKFGTFRLRWSKERRIKHPKTGESIVVPPAPRVTFTPAKQLREWIEPNPRPVVPLNVPLEVPLVPLNVPLNASLNEPLDESPADEQLKPNPEKAGTTSLSETKQTADEPQQQDQTSLLESVQDIIDEQYSPPDGLSEVDNTQTSLQTDIQTKTDLKKTGKSSKKLTIGLLAAVPLIIYLLQADFSNNTPDATTALPSNPVAELQSGTTAESINTQVIRTDSSALDNEPSNISDETIQTENIATVSKLPNINNELLTREEATQTESVTEDNEQSVINDDFIQTDSIATVSETPIINNELPAQEIVIQTESITEDNEQSIISDDFIQTENTATENTPSSTFIETIQAESIVADNAESSANNEFTNSESTQFYLSPQVHTIQQGENLWNLAKQFYGDAMLWPHIYRANTRTLSEPDKIISGKKLVIPGLQQSPGSLTNNDKELIAEGYFLVYQFNKTNGSDQAIYFLIGAKQYNFDWLRQKKPQIDTKDWRTINKYN